MHVDAGPQADPDQTDLQTRNLIRELKQLNIGLIETLRQNPPPPGAKAGEAIEPGVMVISVSPSVVETVILFLRDWSSRGVDRRVTFSFQQGDSLLEIEYDPAIMTQENLQELIATLLQGPETES